MNFFRSTFISCILFSVFAVQACAVQGNDTPTDSLSPDSSSLLKTSAAINYRSPVNGSLTAFYVLNNVNGGSPDTATLYHWLDPFLDSISKRGYDPKDELFTNNGGGVMNAQYDPAADILIIGFFEQKPDTGSVLFTVNDFPIRSGAFGGEKMTGKDMYMCWCILDQHDWNYMRHLASDKEVDSICVKRNMKRDEWVKNSCTVLRLAVSGTFKGVKSRTENYLLLQFGN